MSIFRIISNTKSEIVFDINNYDKDPEPIIHNILRKFPLAKLKKEGEKKYKIIINKD